MENPELIIYTDGASRGNPGEAGIGVVVVTAAGEPVAEIADYLGRATNNVAEYTALQVALEKARELGARRIEIRSDSELMVRQLNGQYKVKNEGLLPLFRAVAAMLRRFEQATVRHIPREQNRRADALANQGIDEKLTNR